MTKQCLIALLEKTSMFRDDEILSIVHAVGRYDMTCAIAVCDLILDIPLTTRDRQVMREVSIKE